MSELDGEVKGCEVISKTSTSYPYNEERYFDQDNFYPMNGEVIPMVAKSAAQDMGDYFDQDNFYPADGVDPNAVNYEEEGSMSDLEFSNAGGLISSIKDYFSKEERDVRKKGRQERKAAKTSEIQSRAELNKSLAQDKPSDVALAEALKSTAQQPTTGASGKKPKMSKNTKTMLIVGGVLAVAVVGFLVYRSVKKSK